MTSLIPWRRKRVAYVPQMEVAECGAACLASVLAFWGHSAPLVGVRQACGVSRDGTNAFAIVHAARGYGMQAHGNQATAQQLEDLDLPLILHWNGNHFVVLERLARRSATIMDPAVGRRRITREELARAFSGIALSFAPGPDFVRRRPASGSWARYRHVLRSMRPAIVMLLVAAFLLELLAVLVPAANQVLIDHVIVPARPHWIWPIIVGLTVAMLARVALRWLRDRSLQILHLGLDLTLVPAFTEHLVHLPYTFFQQRTPGDLMQRVDANRSLREVGSRAITGLLDGTLVVVYSAVMLAYDPFLGAIAVLTSFARIGWVLALRPFVQQAVASELTARGSEQGVVTEAFSVPEVVKAFSAENLLEIRHAGRAISRVERTIGLRRTEVASNQSASIFDGLAMGACIWFGGRAVIHEQMTLGVLAGFLTLQGLLRAPLGSVIESISQLTYARGVMARIDDVLDSPREPGGGLRLSQARGEIRFEGVRFRYGPLNPWVCDGLDLHVCAGEKVAIVGRIGQGKTTLTRLVLGMLSPEEGRITIDGRDLRELDVRSLRASIGVVLQEPFLLSDTIRNNISLHVPDASIEQVREAARIACIDDVITELREGYDSRIGPGGLSLSGGQRQRLALARALVHRPSVLVLDEATSSLDLTTEARVHANLAAVGCTRLVIAHRLTTVRDADRILVFDRGVIAEQGTYDSLLRRGGLLADMVRTME